MNAASKILVTGATSQTGSLAVRALLREGYAVRCLVRREQGKRYLPESEVEIARGDLEKPDSLLAALEGMQAVAHIAHIRFAPALIAACAAKRIRRAVFMSSTRRYTRFDCPSARQVREGESAIEASDLDYTILRPSMIYGSSRDNNVSRLIRYLRRHRVFPLVGGGRNRVQPVFVLDVVEALLTVLRRGATVRSAYTLAGPAPLTYRRMIEIIAGELNRRVLFVPVPIRLALVLCRAYEVCVSNPRVTSEQIHRFAEDRAFDITTAQDSLDFRPVEFAAGVQRQLAGELDGFW